MIKPRTVKQSFYIHLLVESGQNINNTRQQQHAWITCAQSPARDLQKNAPPTSAHEISLPAILWADVVFPLQPAYDLHSMRAACSTRWERVNTTLLPERQWKLPDICSFELKLSESETEKVGDKCTPADLLAASNAGPPHCRYSHVWCIIHVPWVCTAFHLYSGKHSSLGALLLTFYNCDL